MVLFFQFLSLLNIFAINKHEKTMDKYSFLAFDLGATSGRAVIGTISGSRFEIEEIHRFPNSILELHGKLYWNIYSIYEELKKALSICAEKGIKPRSIGIDTWGVDFGYIAKDGSISGLPRAYRDPYTDGIPEELFQTVPRTEIYGRTGIQVMYFNSLYQLLAAKREGSEALRNADKILFMPDLLAYMLTGRMVCEYTEATTSQMINAATRQFDSEMVEKAGINPKILLPVSMPGTLIGELTDSLANETGIGKVPVYAVAGHDTASAIAAIPAEDNEFAFLSSGTWSLMGIECEQPIIDDRTFSMNLTNEGGIDGTICFLNNITGMWLLEQCRKEWEKKGKKYSYSDIMEMAGKAEPLRSFINPNDTAFTNPTIMTEAIMQYCKASGQAIPESDAAIVRCIFESLALCYRHTLDKIKEVAPHKIKRLHIIGGGAKNELMNQFAANATGLTVIAGPSEATAIGNCMIQARAAGLAGDRWEMRRLIGKVIDTRIYQPEMSNEWQKAYCRYKDIIDGAKR